MKQFIFLCSICAIVCTFTASGKGKWENLFNGKDLKNWETIGGEAEYAMNGDEMVGTTKAGTPNTFLVSKKSYSDFILEYEMFMAEPTNSGVQIRSHSLPDYKNGRFHGYQVETDPSNRGWSGGIYDEARRGWLYPLELNPQAIRQFKLGEWNKFRVEAVGNSIRTWINGIPAAEIVDNMTPAGYFGFQVHSIGKAEKAGTQIKWRNVRIMEGDLTSDITPNKGEVMEMNYMLNTLSPRENKEGWKLLWDGKTSEGWRGAKLAEFPAKGWEINEGILTVKKGDGGESTNGGDIVTQSKYTDFMLSVDFRITEGANSGIKYFVDTELNKGEGSSIGCEFQILDDVKHPDAKMGVAGNRTLGSLYDLITANAKLYNPNIPAAKYFNGIGGWNRAIVIVKDAHVEHWLNGNKVVEYERGTQMWKALVAYSKYASWPAFGEAQSGHILLQDHGDEVSFKNIKIKELK